MLRTSRPLTPPCCTLQMAGWYDALAGLPALATLDLRHCSLRELPAPGAQLSSLTALLLSGNQLNTLPVGPYLQHLERLDLEITRQAGRAGRLQGRLAGLPGWELLHGVTVGC